ncbi:MAG: hypothetical protein V4505_25700 [Pseudomonadota bacterium]
MPSPTKAHMPSTRLLPAAQVFHVSTRSSVSENTDAVTLQRSQVMTVSRLEMGWEAGQLQIRCAASRLALTGSGARPVTVRPRPTRRGA